VKKEGFVLAYVDPTELYALDSAMLCTGDKVTNLKEVVKYFEKSQIIWEHHDDFFGRAVRIGRIVDSEAYYVIYPVKPPENWKLVK
jgi:hypothetical protein